MAAKRRSASTFSLSFLDIMSCGLGATVLLFLILEHNSDPLRTDENLSSEVNLLEEEILIGEANLARIRNTISEVDDQLAEARGLARRIQDEIDELRGQLAILDPNAEESIAELQERLARLEAQKKLLEAEIAGGNRVRQFIGEGQRQYLTGIRLGGDYVLILVDASASMLDETIVDVIRRRVRSDDIKLQSPKWQQTQRIVEWVVANIPHGAPYQIVAFNEEAKPLVAATEGKWLATDNNANVELSIRKIRELVPAGGTNLHNAFTSISSFAPRPDNIFLITDGLPTIGQRSPSSSQISASDRLKNFNEAARLVNNASIPFNIMLLPMEGDPMAAAAFWQLSLDTRGSFLTPSSDWP